MSQPIPRKESERQKRWLIPFEMTDFPYSDRNASTGSRREALEAGYVPKNRPTLSATINPLSTDQNCTAAGSGVAIETSFAALIPQSTPTQPPMTAIDND